MDDILKLAELSRTYLAAGQFGRNAQSKFSSAFHNYYHSADREERICVSELLCNVRGVPLDVLTLLCCDDDAVASPVLAHSPLLDEASLTTQILQGTGAERQAIAKRKDLNTMLISHLLSFGEKPVARALLSNNANLPDTSKQLLERMMRLADTDREQTGRKTMTKDKGKLDALVSSMEKTWQAHYQPKVHFEDIPTKTTGSGFADPSSFSAPAVEPKVDVSQDDSLFNADDLKILEALSEDDWQELDDATLEKVAVALANEAREEMAASATADNGVDLDDSSPTVEENAAVEASSGKSGKRFSFKIGADDADNAPIPPLEPSIGETRAATIAFKGEINAEPALKHADAAIPKAMEQQPNTLQAATPVKETLVETQPSIASSTSLDVEQTRVVDAVPASNSSDVADKKPKITLTIRKRSHDQHEPAKKTELETETPKVQLSSATEDDWHLALERLNKEYSPESAEQTKTHAFEKREFTSDNLAPATKADAAIEAVLSDNTAPVQPSISIGKRRSSEPVKVEDRVVEPAASSVELPKPLEQKATEAEADNKRNLGFMPDLISLEDLELVEATPDIPSATELLLKQQKRATPYSELIEPVELDYIENGKTVSLDEVALSPMQVITEQIAAQRAETSTTVLAPNSQPLSSNEFVDAARSEDTDISDLPEFAGHRTVDAEEYAKLRQQEEAKVAEQAAQSTMTSSDHQTAPKAEWLERPIDLVAILGEQGGSEGAASAFYEYDAETRLTLLQTMIADTMVDVAMLKDDLKQRVLLNENDAEELVMARFGNDRIRLSERMHDLSGHRRMDMTQLLQDQGGEALVVYLYHIGLDEARTLSMVLHGPDSIAHDYTKIAQLMTLYNQLYPAAAARIVEQLFGKPHRPQTKHLPIHDDGAGAASPRLRGQTDQRESQTNPHSAPTFGRRVSRPE